MLQSLHMPELPEVEIMRRGLEKYLVGQTIEKVEIIFPKIFSGDGNNAIGATVQGVRRYGKGMVIDLSNGLSIAVHVKMTGQFVYKETRGSKGSGETEGIANNFHPKLHLPETLPNKHTHVIFTFRPKTNDQRPILYYNDIRKFGWLKVIKTIDIPQLPFFKNLGPEPFVDLTLPIFQKILSSTSMPIKPLLMDQKKISGVGNIYANDALYGAQVDPRRPGKSISSLESALLYKMLLEVLQKGIDLGGASEINYIHIDGGKGEYQDHFLVYGKAGKACRRCGTEILRIVQAGRSTFYCPACQS